MKRGIGTFAILALLFSNSTLAQSNKQAGTKKDKEASHNPQAAAASNLTGNGTPGRLSKWVGTSGSNTFVLGDSNIFEDKFGKVGIGTITPTSLLTVHGMIETTMGGYKFPDGTIQSTAFSAGQVVSSLNGLKGDVILAAGSNITITPSGNTLTIAAPNSLTTVVHDMTLQGNGTAASPLGFRIPQQIVGSVDGISNSILEIRNTGDGGSGLSIQAGDAINSLDGGVGVFAFGGASVSGGGDGVEASGGNGAVGGAGVSASGGNSSGSGPGGAGVRATGGPGGGGHGGGIGVFTVGGTTDADAPGSGGSGLHAVGGGGFGAGKQGGFGIVATRGIGVSGATNGLAGFFLGDVEINGALNVTGTKNFKIDHPLDPENKYLYHAAIESSEVLNVYSGNVTTNEKGEAIVTLPDWFESLNRDFRYQLTVVGTFAQAIVADEIQNNHFKIKTNAAVVKVSWQVTGVRSDAVMLKHPFKAEENKPEHERGHYFSPEAYGRPEERSVEWARFPEVMQRMKETRLRQTRIEAESLKENPKP